MRLFFAVVVLVIIVVAGVAFLGSSGEPPVTGVPSPSPTVSTIPSPTPPAATGPTAMPPATTAATIHYTDSGYSPDALSVPRGTAVSFINESSGSMWTASDPHPTHTAYPGTNRALCDNSTPPFVPMFDACGRIEPGMSYTFTFTEPGTWGFHNHLNPSQQGRVVVSP